jgi:hypothetical protein
MLLRSSVGGVKFALSRRSLRSSRPPRRQSPCFDNGLVTLLATILLLCVGNSLPTLAAAADGDSVIEWGALGSNIHLATSARFSGAIASLVYRGKEYIDTRDHGREMQSASSYDDVGECFNPTEAGSIADAAGPTSSSKLLEAKGGPNWLETKTDMAFWLPPGYDYKHQCGTTPTVTHAVNSGVRGGHILVKHIEMGEAGEPNVISDRVVYTIPEAHRNGTFEAATIYTPKDFASAYTLNFEAGNVEPTKVLGEQGLPLILATPDGKNAVGIFSFAMPKPGSGYGLFILPNTNKINCVFREKSLAAGSKFSYQCDFVIGTLAEVRASILRLHQRQMRELSQNQ